jgi:hypothetical protein
MDSKELESELAKAQEGEGTNVVTDGYLTTDADASR